MNEIARSWIDFAQRDLAVAEAIINDEYVANAVMFHSQQIVEKALKALFEEHGKKIPRIHSLTKLYGILIEDDIVSSTVIDTKALFFLDEVYLDARYPGGLGLLPHRFPTTADAQDALDIARKILTTIIDILQ
jgi:HEPN domain-containing protein